MITSNEWTYLYISISLSCLCIILLFMLIIVYCRKLRIQRIQQQQHNNWINLLQQIQLHQQPHIILHNEQTVIQSYNNIDNNNNNSKSNTPIHSYVIDNRYSYDNNNNDIHQIVIL